jgi:hypothetical protein
MGSSSRVPTETSTAGSALGLSALEAEIGRLEAVIPQVAGRNGAEAILSLVKREVELE